MNYEDLVPGTQVMVRDVICFANEVLVRCEEMGVGPEHIFEFLREKWPGMSQEFMKYALRAGQDLLDGQAS